MLCHGTNSKNISTSNKPALAGTCCWGLLSQEQGAAAGSKIHHPELFLACFPRCSRHTVTQPPLLNCQTRLSRPGLVRQGPGDASVPPHTAVIKKDVDLNTECCCSGGVARPSGGSRRWWSTASQGLLVLNCHRPVSCLCHRVSRWQDGGRDLSVPSGAKKVSFFVQEWAGVPGSGILWNFVLCCVVWQGAPQQGTARCARHLKWLTHSLAPLLPRRCRMMLHTLGACPPKALEIQWD